MFDDASGLLGSITFLHQYKYKSSILTISSDAGHVIRNHRLKDTALGRSAACLMEYLSIGCRASAVTLAA